MLTDEQIVAAIAPLYTERRVAQIALTTSRNEYRAIESAACAERDARIAELTLELEEARQDAERLDWMIFYSARVSRTNDAEYCSVQWVEDYEERQTDTYGDPRAAIDAAMKEQT